MTLIKELKALQHRSVYDVVEQRMADFKQVGSDPDLTYRELCFCIMTANFNAKKAIAIQSAIGLGFHTLCAVHLQEQLKKHGCRFHNKAPYMVAARNLPLTEKLSLLSGQELREWIVQNVKGLGMKEASHFLRNIGYTDYAIIDFHIVDILVEHGLVERPKTMTPKKYLEIESVLKTLGEQGGLDQARLDLYLWYLETGRVMK